MSGALPNTNFTAVNFKSNQKTLLAKQIAERLLEGKFKDKNLVLQFNIHL
jgi:hypothetical protein